MKKTINSILTVMGNVLSSFFAEDTVLISQEALKILSNKEDAAKYIKAIEELKSDEVSEVTIILSTGESITLI